MKKVCLLLCVFLVTITLSACQAFHDDTTQNHAQDNPLETVVFLQVKNSTTGLNIADELTNWKSRVLIENAAITNENAPKIIDVNPTAEDNGTYTVQLKIQNVPDTTTKKETRPFKITYTQTVFNPIALLPESNTFLYIVGYTSQRRHSQTNTEQIVTSDNGEYIYFWTDSQPIIFVDVYPNRPLYYLIIVVGAAVIGGFVYLVSRYYDCKKQKKQL